MDDDHAQAGCGGEDSRSTVAYGIPVIPRESTTVNEVIPLCHSEKHGCTKHYVGAVSTKVWIQGSSVRIDVSFPVLDYVSLDISVVVHCVYLGEGGELQHELLCCERWETR